MRLFLSGLIICLTLGFARAAEPSANLVRFTKDVLVRRLGATDWGKASRLMDLFGKDTVYTMAGSRAEVRFHTGERLLMAPNTLVVLHPPGKKDAGVEMVAGELLSRRSRRLAPPGRRSSRSWGRRRRTGGAPRRRRTAAVPARAPGGGGRAASPPS